MYANSYLENKLRDTFLVHLPVLADKICDLFLYAFTLHSLSFYKHHLITYKTTDLSLSSPTL
jgi:hypothetical protein